MAQEKQHKSHEYGTTPNEGEVQDRGGFDFLGNKKEKDQKPQGEVISTKFDNQVKVSDEPETKPQENQEPEKKHSLLEKLHQSNSTSSSSSDEEKEGEGGEKKKNNKEKKGIKEKIGEKIGCGDDKEEKKQDDEAAHKESEEKKGLIDKVKEKLPGQHKKAEEVPPTSSEYDVNSHTEGEANDKEKKGLLDKIKYKLPGHHTKPNEDKEKETATQ